MPFVFIVLSLIALQDPPMAEMQAIRRHLHENPELSNREFKTQAYLMARLKEAGFERLETMAKTGIRVVYETGRPGPVIALRADIDALPITEKTGLPFASKNAGVMHGCGHDLHTAMVFGAALAIKADDSLAGTYIFLFQPAEEGPPPGEEGGASLMIADGALKDPKPDYIFGLHVLGQMQLGEVGYRAGGIMARADRFKITIKGVQSHGSAPQNGIDPIYVASQVVSQAQSLVSRRTDARDPVVLSFGQIRGGNRFNIIPEQVEMVGTIRTFDPETGDRIPQLIDQLVAGITSAHGASYVFENETLCPSTQNDGPLIEQSVQALKAAELNMVNVDPAMFAEDFAYFAQKIPGAYFFIGAAQEQGAANIHTPQFSPSEDAMKVGFKLYMTLVRHFSAQGASP